MSLSRMHWIILASLLAVVLAYLARDHRPYGLSAPDQPLPTDILRIADRKFTVEIASTPGQLQRGLQHRTHLAPDAGMLFVLARSEVANFWMKDTLIPLDMLFLDATGRVVSTHLGAQPCHSDPCRVYSSGQPVSYVLELAAGQGQDIPIGTQASLPSIPIEPPQR